MAFVYWIKAPHHTDILTEGYVGVTSITVEHRFSQHMRCARDGSTLSVHKAIRKYVDDITVQTILEGPEEYCYEFEASLRPSPKIGYNLAAGGGGSPMSGLYGEDNPNFGRVFTEETRRKIGEANSGENNGMFGKRGPLNHFYGKTHTAETRAKLSAKVVTDATREKLSKAKKGTKRDPDSVAKSAEANRGKKRTPEQCKKISDAQKGKKRSDEFRQACSERMKDRQPWENNRCNPEVWLMAADVFSEYLKNSSGAHLGRLFNVARCKLYAMISRFRGGWIPSEDSAWLEFKQNHTGATNGT